MRDWAMVALLVSIRPKTLLHCGALLLVAVPCSGQIDAGLLARVRDREMTSTYDASSNRSQITLTLVLPSISGSDPQATLMFTAQFRGREPELGTTSFFVRTHYLPRADPRRRDPRTLVGDRDLIFELDPQTKTGIRLFLYAANYGYGGFVPPGDEVPLAFFTLTPAELRALAVPHAISGRALGSEFSLEPAQLDALREFVHRTVR
jgi:hypothetical protein